MTGMGRILQTGYVFDADRCLQCAYVQRLIWILSFLGDGILVV